MCENKRHKGLRWHKGRKRWESYAYRGHREILLYAGDDWEEALRVRAEKLKESDSLSEVRGEFPSDRLSMGAGMSNEERERSARDFLDFTIVKEQSIMPQGTILEIAEAEIEYIERVGKQKEAVVKRWKKR